MAMALALGSGATFLLAGTAYVASREDYRDAVRHMAARRRVRRSLSRRIRSVDSEGTTEPAIPRRRYRPAKPAS